MKTKNLRNSIVFLLAIAIAMATVSCKKDPAKVNKEALAAAEASIKAGDYSQAIIHYKNAVKAIPNSAESNFLLGQALFHEQQYQDAFAAFRRSSTLDATYVPARVSLGQLYLLGKMWDDALRTAQEILDKHPDDPAAPVIMANAYLGKGMPKEAKDTLNASLAKNPKYIATYLGLAMVYGVQGDSAKAKQYTEQAIQIDPKDVGARRSLASLLMAHGDIAGADTQFKAAIDQNPTSVDAYTAYAAFLIQTRRTNDAEAVYKRLIDLQKNSPQARYDLATLYASTGKTAQADALDREIVKDSPNFILARLQLAELAVQAKNYDEANRQLAEVSKVRPRDVQLLMIKARMQLDQKKPDEAIKSLEMAAKYEPNIPSIHYLMGIAYTQSGNLQRAQSSFEQAIGIDAKFVDADTALAELMLARGQPDNALINLDAASKIAPGRPDIYLLKGAAYLMKGNAKEAKAALGQFITMSPNSPTGYSRMGFICLNEKNLPEAEKSFEKSLSIAYTFDALDGLTTVYRLRGDQNKAIERIKGELAKGERAELYLILGRNYMEMGDSQQAETNLRKTLALDPQNYGAYVVLGSLYAKTNKSELALREYESAVKVRPKEPALWTMIGMIYQQQNNPTEARAAYEKALDAEPNAGVAANNLALIYSDAGDYDKALELARRAKVAMPDLPAVTDTLGWLYYKRGLFDMAKPLLQEAAAKEPGNAEFRLHYGAALLSKGDKQKAKTEVMAALKLNPAFKTNKDAQLVLSAK